MLKIRTRLSITRKFLILLVLLIGVFTWNIRDEYQKVSRTPVSSWLEDRSADCAVVLTGSVGRVKEGFDALARKQVKNLIISGVHPRSELRQIFPQWPFYGDIKEENVILEKQSRTTYGNARQSLAIIGALHCRDILLITSRLHMKRAYDTFKSVFPPDYPIYVRAVVSGNYYLGFWETFIESCKSFFYSLWAY